ncbi:hypothetical protein R1flu_023967 [Riccia fluitans]|uniref:Uncharacterized protein n=1 Tax=Riccia fluitans TaxID=41844 RepID=A0ABD1XTI9_9MARC
MRDLGLSNPPCGGGLLGLRKGQGSQMTTRADHRAGKDPANPPKSNGHLYSGRTPAGDKLGQEITRKEPTPRHPGRAFMTDHARQCGRETISVNE